MKSFLSLAIFIELVRWISAINHLFHSLTWLRA